MIPFIVHTVRKNIAAHFFYVVKASKKEEAFTKLVRARALFSDEEHYETIQIAQLGDADSHELIYIFKEETPEELFSIR